jgi:hypothetical protein
MIQQHCSRTDDDRLLLALPRIGAVNVGTYAHVQAPACISMAFIYVILDPTWFLKPPCKEGRSRYSAHLRRTPVAHEHHGGEIWCEGSLIGVKVKLLYTAEHITKRDDTILHQCSRYPSRPCGVTVNGLLSFMSNLWARHITLCKHKEYFGYIQHRLHTFCKNPQLEASAGQPDTP